MADYRLAAEVSVHSDSDSFDGTTTETSFKDYEPVYIERGDKYKFKKKIVFVLCLFLQIYQY